MDIFVLLLFFLITTEARFFLIETKEKTTTKNEIFFKMTNSGTFLISTGKCHKEWKKANHQLTRWNVQSKICGNEECMRVAEKLHQICKEVVEEDASIGDIETVNNGGALEKGCDQITALLDRCKGSSWKPRLWLERTKENKFGDYQH